MPKLLPHFNFLYNDRYRHYIMYGSRGSAKSYHVADRILHKMLTEPYCRGVLHRKRKNTVFDSQIKALKKVAVASGIDKFFRFLKHDLRVICTLNGNEAIGKGSDDPDSIKSIDDPTFVWYEEEIPDLEAYTTISTSLRGSDNIAEYYTINPIIKGDYKENWFFQKHFAEKYGKELSFDDFENNAFVHHSTYRNNPNVPKSLIEDLQNLEKADKRLFDIYSLGLFANKQYSNIAYNVPESIYSTGKVGLRTDSLDLTFDFNVVPYITCTVWHTQNNVAYQLNEILVKHPEATTENLCNEILRQYPDIKKFRIFGDPAGNARSTKTNYTDFQQIQKILSEGGKQLEFKVATQASRVKDRLTWQNAVFADARKVKISINDNCKMTKAEYKNVLTDSEGNKSKKKVVENGITFEKFGHISDANDYYLTVVFQEDFKDFFRLIKKEINIKQALQTKYIQQLYSNTNTLKRHDGRY